LYATRYSGPEKAGAIVNDMPGRLIVRGLRCRGRQGPTPTDQQQAHDYLVDVRLSVDIADAAARDDLAAALDIAEVASVVRDEVARRPRTLLERMASDIARALLERFERVTEVRVKVEKPEPDGLDAAAEAVELTMSRELAERPGGAQ
jgi:dihydroneopterin aldolase